MGKVLQFPQNKRNLPTFQQFGLSLRRRDISGAAAVLGRIFAISDVRALQATTFLLHRLATDPTILDLLRTELRSSVQSGNANAALSLLLDNFGFNGAEAVHVLTALIKYFEVSEETG